MWLVFNHKAQLTQNRARFWDSYRCIEAGVSVFTAFTVLRQVHGINLFVQYVMCVWDISLVAIPERNGGVRNSVDLIISSLVPSHTAFFVFRWRLNVTRVQCVYRYFHQHVGYPVGSNMQSDAIILNLLPFFLCGIT